MALLSSCVIGHDISGGGHESFCVVAKPTATVRHGPILAWGEPNDLLVEFSLLKRAEDSSSP